MIDAEKIVLEKGNWVGYQVSAVGVTASRFAVARKEGATNRLVSTSFPKIDLLYEGDCKSLVELLARLEKIAISSLKQIRKESHALRAKEIKEEILNRQAAKMAEASKQATSLPHSLTTP